jgi:hypothetical protein
MVCMCEYEVEEGRVKGRVEGGGHDLQMIPDIDTWERASTY